MQKKSYTLHMMRTTSYIARSVALLGLVLLLIACGRQESEIDRTAEWLEKGKQTLSDAIVEYFINPLYDTQWDFENAETKLDEERFPAWAQDSYDACVYWRTTFSDRVINENRRPGNSSQFLRRSATAWGWILVGNQSVHILELGYQYDANEEYDTPDGPVIKINAWDNPYE